MIVADPAEPLLARLSPEVQALVQQLRTLIKEVMPPVSEKVHLGWAAIHYQAGNRMRDVAVALVPQRSYVNLEFGDGVDLPDPAHRLEGTGKRLRHVKIRSSTDAQHSDMRHLLEAAAHRRGL